MVDDKDNDCLDSCPKRDKPQFVHFEIWLEGEFLELNDNSYYVNGGVTNSVKAYVSKLTLRTLHTMVQSKMKEHLWLIYPKYSIWFKKWGLSLFYGRTEVISEKDVELMVNHRDNFDGVFLWIVEDKSVIPPGSEYGFRAKFVTWAPSRRQGLVPGITKEHVFSQPLQIIQPKFHQVSNIPNSKGNIVRGFTSSKLGSVIISKEEFEKKTSSILAHKTQLKCCPTQKIDTPSISPPLKNTPKKKLVAHKSRSPFASPAKKPTKNTQTITSNTPLVCENLTTTTPFKLSTHRGESNAKHSKKVSKKSSKEKGKEAKDRKRKTKTDVGKSEGSSDEWEGSSDDTFSHLDVGFDAGDEDRVFAETQEAFLSLQDLDAIVVDVASSLGGFKESSTFSHNEEQTKPGRKKADTKEKDPKLRPQVFEEIVEAGLLNEDLYDSDDLRSLNGSDDEAGAAFTTFNNDIDFKKSISLVKGLRFTDIYVVRKAIQSHAIENRYDYYLLHNGGGKVTAKCRHRCKCPWDMQHSKIKCACNDVNKCEFTICVRKIKGEETYHVTTMNLIHTCGAVDVNSKVTSEWLAGKFIGFWRDDPYASVHRFIEEVLKVTGVTIGYYKAWLARARAKLLIYGDGAHEYAKVNDYAHAILKYNPGSTTIVHCIGVEKPKPIFQRMYVCMDACKNGFKAGCKPLIGVDGCHLKGTYPGMILSAIAKDGNNCIFPIAWAVVEVEDKHSWRWFLELLVIDIELPRGKGLTIMSDRQKGLIDALSVVVPEAEIRLCARHIWANFKNQFSGAAFKETFWRAVRTSSKYTFDEQMEEIRLLSEDAYKYLANIPTNFWARHAFQTTSKSNMLLNNICETFNSVIKQARDKPIISCLEWIRRYVMKRNCEKWNQFQEFGGKLMPYVGTIFKWVMEEAKNCRVVPSRLGQFEVSHCDDRFAVDLVARTYSCYKWDLTGIPCPHAYACIIYKRHKPEDYVDHYYSKERFMLAYGPHIKPMPDIKQWNATDLAQPLPPPIRKMPGRPSKRKRHPEQDEVRDDMGRYVQKDSKRKISCSNCGQVGHNKKKCKNPHASNNEKGKGKEKVKEKEKEKNKGGRPFSTKKGT